MTRWIAVLAVIVGVSGANSAQAQTREAAPGPGTLEVTIIPGGATFFTEATDTGGPSFGNYDLGGSVTYNFNRYVGVEGEVSGLLGVSQTLDFAAGAVDVTTPHFLNYSGNVIVSRGRGPRVPYAPPGIRGLSLAVRAEVGVAGPSTFPSTDGG